MRKEEIVIKEQRTLEATKKKLMGPEGKLGVILKQLGQPIISHDADAGMYNQTFLELYESIDDEDEWSLPTIASGEENAPYGWEWSEPKDADFVSFSQIGWHFDGLSRRMHLEIKYDDLSKTLTLHYKGYLVFEETAGDLVTYIPNPEWENMINQLYSVAEPIKYKKEIQEREDQKKLVQKAKKNFLQKMRERWGI